MLGIRLTAALPLLSLALTYALRGGRTPQAFAVGVLPLLFLPFSAHFRDAWFSQERSLRPLLAYFAWAVLCLAAAPPLYFHLSRLSVFAAFLLFAAAASLWNDQEKRVFLAAVLFLGLIESVFLLVLHLSRNATMGYLFGNPIYTALAATTALLTIGVFSKEGKKAYLVPAAILLIVALTLTQSRSTLVGLLVAMAFLAPRRRYFTGLAILAGAIALLGLVDGERLLGYLKVDFARPEDLFGRLTIWRSALAASLENPIFGWGLGNFEAGYLRHQFPVPTVLRFDRSTIFAHNDFLQLAAETGWPGAALGLWALGSFVRAAWKRMDDPFVRWSVATVALYATAGLFNFTFFLPYNGFVAAAAFGMGTGGGRTNDRLPAPAWSRAWVAVPVFLFVFATLNGISETFRVTNRPHTGARVLPIRADLWYETALTALRRGDGGVPNETEAISALKESLRWNPQDPFVWDRLGMVKMAISSADSIAAFSRAIDLAPTHAPFWLDAGFERLRAGDEFQATFRFNRALELEPNAPLCWFALAVAAQERGEKKKATEFLEKAISLGKQYRSVVRPSGYASYMFGMDEEQMRSALSARRPRASTKRS